MYSRTQINTSSLEYKDDRAVRMNVCCYSLVSPPFAQLNMSFMGFSLFYLETNNFKLQLQMDSYALGTLLIYSILLTNLNVFVLI